VTTREQAEGARDALIECLGLRSGPHPDVAGVGITREDGEYVVHALVTHMGVDLPTDVDGVPVRACPVGLVRALGEDDCR
jgi:hypothetical protein